MGSSGDRHVGVIRTACWLLGAVLALAGRSTSSAQAPARAPASPAPGVIAAWDRAGAEFGWMSIGQEGEWRLDEQRPASGGWPAFRFRAFPTGKLKGLVPPDVPFGLWLTGSRATDANLKELA